MLKQNDRANEISKVRAGTRCKICGEPITAEDFRNYNVVSTDGGCLGSIIYGHAHCCTKREYSYEHLVRNKKATYTGVQFGVELETNDTTTAEQRLYLYACYGLVCTSDCTVSEEFKSGINQGLHGIKKYFEGIEKVVNISSGENCGSHINISLAKWGNTSKICEYSEELFTPLAKAIRALDSAKRVEIFGRDFGSYREYTEKWFEHGDWLQIKSKCLEFRISRYKNATQYSHLIMLYAEWVKVIDKTFLSNPNEQTAKATAKKMIHLLDLHTKGKAKYQYSERNK
jgi:hypothetical protein